MNLISALFAGLVFGIGLLLSGMTNPAKIQNFLDIFGAWDPSLIFVMCGAILVVMPGYFLLRKQSEPLFAKKFQWPTKTQLDHRLLFGSALFGVGWGLGGFCPGPAIASIPYSAQGITGTMQGITGALWFVPAMLLGLYAAKLYRWHTLASAHPETGRSADHLCA